MKIKKIKINNYGKIENKEIYLKNKINIIYGKNESGKSTLLSFIKNILYGISKNKNGKNISDYEKYKPWGKTDYSGKIKYILDNNEEYEIYRDFNKKNPKIFNKDMEDISKEYNIDKKEGVQYFFNQTAVDEEMFTSTLMTMQEEIKLNKQEQNILVQKLANLTRTGDDNLSYKKILDKINKIQIEEIGTDRTQERPINLAKEKKKYIEKKLEELQEFHAESRKIESEKIRYESNINQLEDDLNTLKQVNIILLCKGNEEAKIKVKKDYLKEKNKKIDELKIKENNLNEKLNEKTIKENQKNIFEKRKKIKKSKKIIFILIFLLIFNILLFLLNIKLFKNNKIINIINYLILPVYLIIILFYTKIINMKINSRLNIEKQKEEQEKKEIRNEINLIEKQIEILLSEKKLEEKEIEKEEIKLDNKIDQDLLNLKLKIKDKINFNNYIEKLEQENINNLINEKQEKLNNFKINLQSIIIKKENIDTALEEMVRLQEEYDKVNEELNDLEYRNKVINITRELISKAYEEMKSSITPKFTENLSKTIAEISSNKYTRVGINDENGLIVENENGDYIPVDLLSIGTIDQLYLSLRLSMIDELSNEGMPIFLDETFAFFDDYRLENILRFLNGKTNEHQLIIFTCTNREQEIMKKIGLEYNLICI